MINLTHRIKKLEPAFIKLIHDRFGFVIHINQTARLIRAITEASNKLNCTPEEYWQQIKNTADNSFLLADLVAAITVGESYFFRDKNQMHLLEKSILPKLIEQKKEHRQLKIWSAGCSSGEEIYTIAMLLSMLIPNMEEWQLDLLGTDINTTALEKAAVGIYNQWSMRAITEDRIQRFFKKNGRNYTLSSGIRDLVDFKYLNLNDNHYPSILNGTCQVDLILCRNVLIYFDNELVEKIMKKLSLCMAEQGYLILGASDPIVTTDTNLVFHHNGAIYFSLDHKKGLNTDG